MKSHRHRNVKFIKLLSIIITFFSEYIINLCGFRFFGTPCIVVGSGEVGAKCAVTGSMQVMRRRGLSPKTLGKDKLVLYNV